MGNITAKIATTALIAAAEPRTAVTKQSPDFQAVLCTGKVGSAVPWRAQDYGRPKQLQIKASDFLEKNSILQETGSAQVVTQGVQDRIFS